jgi:hypothetical protein
MSDSPTVEMPDGFTCWMGKYGNLHRLTGPAVIRSDGSIEWWINGFRYYNFKSFQEAAKLTDDQITILILKYGAICDRQ